MALSDSLDIEAICASLREGTSLGKTAKDAGVSREYLSWWLNQDASRSARARDARSAGASAWDEQAESVIAAAADPFELAKAKELAHHYRWRSSKLAPKQYGDKLELASDPESPLTVVVRRMTASA